MAVNKCQNDDGPMRSRSVVPMRLTPLALSYALIAFIGLVCLSLIAATIWQVHQSRGERRVAAETAVSNIVRAAEQQARDTVSQVDNTLRDLVERAEHDGTAGDQRERLVQFMAQAVLHTKGIQGLFIYDAQGNWVANSFGEDGKNKNNSDRAYFGYHQNTIADHVHIGSIVVSRTTGDLVIPISRRVNGSDGGFAGVVLATVPVAYFQSFFDSMEVDDKGVIFLALDNGDLLARRPALTALMTTNISKGDIFSKYLPHSDSGTAALTSVVDGVERIYAYRRLADFPLVTAAGISCQNVFAPWWAYVAQSFGMIGLLIVILGSLGSLLYRQIKQLIAAEEKLRAASHELEVISLTDGLTHLANRRCFDMTVKKEWSRSVRGQSELTIVLMDIDWFKQFNDHYGHLDGDECLREVARLISSNVNRAGDLAARFGGEEFVVLLPGTNLAGGLSIAEKIRAAINDACLVHAASPMGHVTISAGVVAIQPDAQGTVEAALAEADRLLYNAKAKGRNCVKGRFISSEHAQGLYQSSKDKTPIH